MVRITQKKTFFTENSSAYKKGKKKGKTSSASDDREVSSFEFADDGEKKQNTSKREKIPAEFVLSENEQERFLDVLDDEFEYGCDDYITGVIIVRILIEKNCQNPDFFAKLSESDFKIFMKAYLSRADGRFLGYDNALLVLRLISTAGFETEIGLVEHCIDKRFTMEVIIGDKRNVVSETGYPFAHTHPARKDIIYNVLPSKQDIDLMIMTARARSKNIKKHCSQFYVLRNIGYSHISVKTNAKEDVVINSFKAEYFCKFDDHSTIESHIAKLKNHLKTVHGLLDDAIMFEKVETAL